MATITLQGILTLTIAADGVTRTDTMVDGDRVDTAWSVGVLLSGTAATARTQMQQLGELAWYSRSCGGVYVSTTHLSIDDGRYYVRTIDRTAGAEKLVPVTIELERAGGGGASGSNLALRVVPSPTLTTNSYSITSTPWYALPVGAAATAVVISQYRASSDGSIPLCQSATGQQFLFSGVDSSTGEVRAWDTGGSGTPANWTRVYGPDHTLAQSHHLAIDNGLIRLTPLSGQPGCHAIEAWDGSAWVTLTDSGGDTVLCGGTAAAGWLAAEILELTPWRCQVRYRMSHAASPYFLTKTITLDRGRSVARVDLTAESAATWQTSLVGLQLTITRRTAGADARDNGVDTGSFTFTAADEPWVVAVATAGTAMAIGGAATTGTAISKVATYGGFTLAAPSATTALWWIGGFAYATAGKIQREAEGGSLFGGASIVTVSGASGGGSNNAVSMPTSGDYCETTGSSNPPAGSRVRAYARIQNVGTSASDEVTVDIWDNTASGVLSGATSASTFSALGSSGSWKWISCEGTAWNGTNTIYPRVRRTASGGGGSLYADQILLVTLTAGVGDGAYPIGRSALTDTRVWLAAARSAL